MLTIVIFLYSTVDLSAQKEANNYNVIKLFLNNKLYYWGYFNCGPHKNTHPAFSNYISDFIIDGKNIIRMNWATGNRSLLLEIKNNGEVSLKGDEKSNGFQTNYLLYGKLEVENKEVRLVGKKFDSNNNLDRVCDAVINFNNSPTEYFISKLKNEIIETKENEKNKNENSDRSLIEDKKINQSELAYIKAKADKEAKEKENERLAAIQIEKKRQKEESDTRLKLAEANRLSAVELEKQKQREAIEAKAKADKDAEIERLAVLEIAKKRQKEEAEAKEKDAKQAELVRLAAIELEKQRQKEAVSARVAAIEAEKIRQNELAYNKEKLEKEIEIERLAVLEIEKKKIREQLEEKAKADALRVAALEAENQRQKEEAEARAKAQRLLELENEMKRLRGETTPPKPVVQSWQDVAKNENDPLSVFEGTWVSVNPPVFYLIFNKVALGIRQVSLPNIGQGNIRLSDGMHGSNFQISAVNLNCYYFVTFTNNRQKMIMELKGGESLCLQSSVLEKAE